ncbi:MAG: alpha/beta fold hydrolase [Chloroflexi bacterium]|nr:alpha/beta fold hydrolase [Chloroflexota bacterium]
MSIPALRLGNYPGSQITIVKELQKGGNYRRYYAYYLSEGLKIYALLTVPEGSAPEGGWPVIVFNHGYIPPDIYKTTERYIAYVDEIAKAGYVVFRIDYRGHDASEGEATGAYGNPGYQIDVLNAVSSLEQYPGVNPEKIGMWGHSMGGYLTLRSMVISRDVKVGVIWAGVVASYPDLLYNWHRSGAFTPSPSSRGVGWRTEWIETFGTPEQNPAFWNSVSATSYLADLSGPLELHHGTADEDVPVEFSIRLAELARSAGQTADLYTYEGDNHNISGNFSIAMNRTIAFFDAHLK